MYNNKNQLAGHIFLISNAESLLTKIHIGNLCGFSCSWLRGKCACVCSSWHLGAKIDVYVRLQNLSHEIKRRLYKATGSWNMILKGQTFMIHTHFMLVG